MTNPSEPCPHEHMSTCHTGDGVEVETCLDCGQHVRIGQVPYDDERTQPPAPDAEELKAVQRSWDMGAMLAAHIGSWSMIDTEDGAPMVIVALVKTVELVACGLMTAYGEEAVYKDFIELLIDGLRETLLAPEAMAEAIQRAKDVAKRMDAQQDKPD